MTCPTREELVAVLDGSSPDLDRPAARGWGGGVLAPDALAAARRHAGACTACQAELARLESTVALLRAGSPAPEPSPLFSTRLAARLAAEAPRRRGLAALLAAHPWRLAVAGGLAVALAAGVTAGVYTVHRARSADELAVAERLELLEDLEVVASLDAVEGPDDVAVIAALAAGAPEGRP